MRVCVIPLAVSKRVTHVYVCSYCVKSAELTFGDMSSARLFSQIQGATILQFLKLELFLKQGDLLQMLLSSTQFLLVYFMRCSLKCDALSKRSAGKPVQ